jgi:hypothetical protein
LSGRHIDDTHIGDFVINFTNLGAPQSLPTEVRRHMNWCDNTGLDIRPFLKNLVI